MIKSVILIMGLIFSLPSLGETYCEKRESHGEGDWPISEEHFTKEKAKNALEYFGRYINKTKDSSRPPEPEDMMDVENEWIMLKGFIYKQIISTNASEHKTYKELKALIRADFCEFIQNEAHVKH